jgi:hypothetical protein
MKQDSLRLGLQFPWPLFMNPLFQSDVDSIQRLLYSEMGHCRWSGFRRNNLLSAGVIFFPMYFSKMRSMGVAFWTEPACPFCDSELGLAFAKSTTSTPNVYHGRMCGTNSVAIIATYITMEVMVKDWSWQIVCFV